LSFAILLQVTLCTQKEARVGEGGFTLE